MCGRYVLFEDTNNLAVVLDAVAPAGLEDSFRPSYNIPPTSTIIGASEWHVSTRELGLYRWGLVPPWAKDISIGNRAFNARAETVATKPMYRQAFREKRILVPANAYYEWHRAGSSKQPYVFMRSDEDELVFGAIWEGWRASREDEWMRSCSIITTEAGEDVEIHNRMPLILERSTWDEWLDPDNQDVEGLERLLRPAPGGTLQKHAVSPLVGSVQNDGPELLDPFVTADGEIVVYTADPLFIP